MIKEELRKLKESTTPYLAIVEELKDMYPDYKYCHTMFGEDKAVHVFESKEKFIFFDSVGDPANAIEKRYLPLDEHFLTMT